MNVRKFHASTTREALRQVRDALGADAIILSNRQVAGGIEIMAVADMDVSSLAGNPVSQPPAKERPAPAEFFTRTEPPPPPTVAPSPISRSQIAELQEKGMPAVVETRDKDAPPDLMNQEIIREIKFLRGMLEGQLSGFAWGELQREEPAKVEALRHLLSVGFSPLLSRQLLDKIPTGYDLEKSLRWLKAALMHNLHVVKAGDDIVERGGVYALTGPTGVGKTTTVAKLAARCTLKHGPASLALITTDTYRIGAHEQLRIYGKILGVPVYVIKDEADLQLTLSDLQNKHLILIDTVGMSQRDRRLSEQVALLSGAGRSIKRILLLSANAQGSTLEDVVRSYKKDDMDGCILTKIDEAISIGPALDVVIRNKLMLHYVANGQRVPEDLHLPNPVYLVDRVLKPAQGDSPFTPLEAEYPMVMAAAGGLESGYTEAKRDVGALRG
ncbi:flagellar biosynthetic protein FlhF [Sulfuricella denitrificans skB26]|uniref:Flagellar biosynthesis protein FlhF n=1 Tax=Sulfuricella denitrificans (strain DSM 22764 / NBRC 105220 / skB26) TaxID=1163617 RepID=S6ABX7_SULDS|nr:flagellar biosynthesis protein FlhF [Sulfuricella denitrificans]BAN35093.1 flagellar biosynthetic protein FlhF [Sulfuricella denitrificans skB26]